MREDPQGVTIRVKVRPKAKRDTLMGVRAGALLVAVTAPPEKGRANQTLIRVLAREFKLPKGSIEIIRGKTSPEKVVRLHGVTQKKLKEHLAALGYGS